MDCFLYNPPANWIVSYKIHLQMVNWIVYMIYFMSRQHLGAYFTTKKGRFKSKMAARGINNVNDALRMTDQGTAQVEQDSNQVGQDCSQ